MTEWRLYLTLKTRLFLFCSSFSTYLFLCTPNLLIPKALSETQSTQVLHSALHWWTSNASITQIPLCSWLLLWRLLFAPVSQRTVLVSQAERWAPWARSTFSISHGLLCCVNIELMTNVYQFLSADWFNMERARAIEHSVLSTCMKLWQSLK